MVYTNVHQPNPKTRAREARERYEYVREGCTVRDCTKRALEEGRLLADYTAKGKKPEPGAYLIKKVKKDTEWDTSSERRYPTCQGPLYKLVKK